VTDVRWVALKVKDGIVDAQRMRFGQRASIDRQNPDLPLRLWLHQDRATLFLDTSGEPLDRRGYRAKTVAAPVREQLAAACILASGWDGQGPVVDPMCGSGTLLIEAAWLAMGQAPGTLRAGGSAGWSFQRFPGYDQRALTAVQGEEINAPGPDVCLIGVDREARAVEAARSNLRRAGLSERVRLYQDDAFAIEPPPEAGLLVINPAYGERLEEEPEQWKRLGDLMKQRFSGWRAVVLAGGTSRGKWIGLRPKRRIPVRNGPLDARILLFDLY
jgi:putative N6-adenine-specific DNA methylase